MGQDKVSRNRVGAGGNVDNFRDESFAAPPQSWFAAITSVFFRHLPHPTSAAKLPLVP